MYKSLISAVVLAGFGVSNFSSSLVFAKEDESEPLIKKSKKTKEKGSNLDISEKPGSLINKKRKKSVTGKQKSGETNEKTKFIIDALSKINLYKILLPICLPTASFMIARHFLNKGQWSENVKDVEVSATENAKEKEITEKDTDSGNSIKQPNQKTLEQPEVNNKDLNKEVGNIDSKDSKVTYKAGFAVVGFVILAIIIYNYLNRAIIEEKQEDETIIYNVNLNKASEEQLETLRNKLKVGDKILLNFKVLQNNRDEFLRKINVLLKGNNNINKMLPILDYEKCEDNLMSILETRKDTIAETKSLSFKVLDDYSGTIISLKEKLEKFENVDTFEKNLNLINNGFGQIYKENSETGVSTFGEILQLAVSSSLIDFTYLRVEKEKLDSAFDDFAMNNVEGWEEQLNLCQITGATGLLYRDILEEVEKNRKNRRDVNNSTASSYKKISTAPSAKDLLDFIDVINKFYNRNYEIPELKEKNLGVNKNLIYTNLLKKFILYIFSNGNTVAKRELYRSEKYELSLLFEECCAIEESISPKVKDEEIKKLLVGLEKDDKQPGLLNLLKNFLKRFKDNTIKKQAPAKFDAVTIDKLARIYNEDYINNKLDVFSGEFWELFKYANNKHNEKNIGNLYEKNNNLYNLVSHLEEKLIGDNNVKLIIEKIYSGEFFKSLYYDDAVGKIYFKFEKEKIPLKEFVAAVESFSFLKNIFLDEEDIDKHHQLLHSLLYLLDVEAQKKDFIALEKGENYLGSIMHQFNSIVKNTNLEKKVKNHFLKNAEKFSKYYERYKENFEEVKSEAEKLQKEVAPEVRYFQSTRKKYDNYLFENVFKNRKHKLPEKLDNTPVNEFIKTYEKYYIDDDLDVCSQEFWKIKNYTRGFRKNGVNLSEEVEHFMGELDYRLVEKAEREIPGLEDIMGRIKSSNFEDLRFDKEKKEVFIEIEGKRISFLNICKVYVCDNPKTDEAVALAPFYNLIDLKHLQYLWVTNEIEEEIFNFGLENIYGINIDNIKNEDVKNYFSDQLEKAKMMFEQYKKENKNARKLADEKRKKGEIKSDYDYNKCVEKLIFENWNKFFLEDLEGIEDIKKLNENQFDDEDIKDLNEKIKIRDDFVEEKSFDNLFNMNEDIPT